jgi:ATP-dependent Clp protease ATP-binding subunit ClpA
MRLLHPRRPGPRASTARPAAEPYLAGAAGEARRLGHDYIGTEHVLIVLTSNANGGATAVLRQLDVSADAVDDGLACWLGTASKPKIDAEALAALGIDFDVVRERLEATFGSGALEQTRAACLGICPRLKMALAYAVDYAEGRPLGDEHILLGMLSVPDSVGARVLAKLGVSLAAARAAVADRR